MAEQPEPDAAPDAVAEEEGGEKKSRGKMGLLLILLPALLLPAAGGAWLVMTRYAQVAQAARALSLVFGDGPEEEKAEPLEFGEFMQLENLIVNPSGSDGMRYLMVTIGLESASPEVLAEIQLKDIVVRDTVLKVLGSHDVSSLSKLETRTRLKHDLKGAINTFLKDGEVDRLYFTQFVLQ